MARTMLILYSVMAISAVLLQLGFGDPIVALIAPVSDAPHSPELDLAAGLCLGLGAVIAWRVASTRTAWARKMELQFRALLQPIRPQHVAGLAVMSALAEELFFRGFLQPRLGLWTTSALFGLAHLPQGRAQLPWTLSAAGLGVALGWLFEARGLLIGPVVAHFTVNFFNLHYLVAPPAGATGS